MKVLVLNSGSSSIKFQLFNMQNEEVLAKGSVTRIGGADALLKYKSEQGNVKKEIDISTHSEGLQVIKEFLIGENGVIEDVDEIDAIGHRVVHGGEQYGEPVIIDDKVEEKIEQLSELAPLHNPHNHKGIIECKKIIPDTPQVAVFDTGFHQTIPASAYLYALPYKYYQKYGIRRYGFHGTSHQFVAQKAADFIGKPIEELKIITCHLGNGASIAAVKNGKSVDTSMGLTPLEGLVMGTRSGDIDPSIVTFLMERENMTTKEIEDVLNTESGLLGVSGITNDFREINQAASEGHERARQALELFYYRIQKYIGSYQVAMEGLDAIVFTGGIGENEGDARKGILQKLTFMGIKIDEEANQVKGEEKEISTVDSAIKCLAIPTDEELVIARESQKLLQKD